MSNQNIDPELAEAVKKLADQAGLAGAQRCLILRDPQLARLFFDIGGGPVQLDLVDGRGQMLVMFRFPVTDGGAERIEVG